MSKNIKLLQNLSIKEIIKDIEKEYPNLSDYEKAELVLKAKSVYYQSFLIEQNQEILNFINKNYPECKQS
jgi:hypothetical protein